MEQTEKKAIGQQDPYSPLTNARIRTAALLIPLTVGDTEEDCAIAALRKADVLIKANNENPYGTLEDDEIL